MKIALARKSKPEVVIEIDTDGLDVVLNSLSDLGTTCSTARVSL